MKFKWTISRNQCLQNCERKYYFRYIIPARTNSKKRNLREVAFLKKLTNVYMWQGKIFHEIIGFFLKSYITKYDESVLQTILQNYIEQIKQQWNLSKEYSQLDFNERLEFIKNNVVLMEHYYNEELSLTLTDIIEDLESNTKKYHDWFLSSDFRELIKKRDEIWIEPLIYGENAPIYEYNNTKIITKVDCAIKTSTGNFIIYDWKTSTHKSSSSIFISSPEFQAIVYQLWPYFAYGFDYQKIKSKFIYFGSSKSKVIVYNINDNLKEYTLNNIRKSIERMNYFKNIYENSIQAKLFDMPSLNILDLNYAYNDWCCVYCQFKQLCRSSLRQ